jgi:hypothetical protein
MIRRKNIALSKLKTGGVGKQKRRKTAVLSLTFHAFHSEKEIRLETVHGNFPSIILFRLERIERRRKRRDSNTFRFPWFPCFPKVPRAETMIPAQFVQHGRLKHG